MAAAFAGFFAAGTLSIGHLLSLPVPCGASGGCGRVAMHPSSKIAGVPIAFFGVAAYLALTFLLTQAPRARWARITAVAVAAFGAATSALLLYYSQTVIRATCPWCVASGICMALLLVLSVAIWRLGPAVRPVRPVVFWSLAFLTATALGVQAGLMQKAASKPPVAAERLGTVTLSAFVEQANSLGPADAPLTIVMFADLWCPACRAVHSSLTKFQQANPAGVRLVFRHVPLWEIRGHESSKAAAALSEMAGERGKFWEFIDAVYAQRQQLDRAGYLALMSSLGFDPDEVEARLGKPDDPAIARVQRDIALAERLGIESTPSFIVVLAGQRPISANQRTLPRLLNSPQVTSRLAHAAQSISTPKPSP